MSTAADIAAQARAALAASPPVPDKRLAEFHEQLTQWRRNVMRDCLAEVVRAQPES
jgi:hypothetical protein